MTKHGRSRLRTLIAGRPTCHCGSPLEHCPARHRAGQIPAAWDAPTRMLSTAPLLTPGQRRTYRQCPDLR